MALIPLRRQRWVEPCLEKPKKKERKKLKLSRGGDSSLRGKEVEQVSWLAWNPLIIHAHPPEPLLPLVFCSALCYLGEQLLLATPLEKAAPLL